MTSDDFWLSCFKLFGFLTHKDFKIIWLLNTLALRVFDEGFHQRASKRCIILGTGWDLINWCNSATFLCLSQAKTWFYQRHISWSLLCSIAWYLWNCCPSLLSFPFIDMIIGKWEIKRIPLFVYRKEHKHAKIVCLFIVNGMLSVNSLIVAA